MRRAAVVFALLAGGRPAPASGHGTGLIERASEEDIFYGVGCFFVGFGFLYVALPGAPGFVPGWSREGRRRFRSCGNVSSVFVRRPSHEPFAFGAERLPARRSVVSSLHSRKSTGLSSRSARMNSGVGRDECVKILVNGRAPSQRDPCRRGRATSRWRPGRRILRASPNRRRGFTRLTFLACLQPAKDHLCEPGARPDVSATAATSVWGSCHRLRSTSPGPSLCGATLAAAWWTGRECRRGRVPRARPLPL